MEIRTLLASEREKVLDLLDGWDLPDGWRGCDFFRRAMEDDPSYADENFWVALQRGELVGCVQIFPRELQILGHPVPTGGIGSVFTHPSWRSRGIAGALLEHASEAMRERRMDLSLLFTDRLSFYEQHGWRSWRSQRMVVRRKQGSEGQAELSPPCVEDFFDFDQERDLAELKRVHAAYSVGRSGVVIRDDLAWLASLKLAGNPQEEFRVARHGGHLVAYLRAAHLYGVCTVIELGRQEDSPDALAALLHELMQPRDGDLLAPPGVSSAQTRAFALLPSFDDLALTVCLEQLGLELHPIHEGSAMLRCLDVARLGERLSVPLRSGEGPSEFLQRVLPDDELVFWPADRF